MVERVAVVTGASRGLGREIARRLSIEGLTVVAVGRDAATIGAAANELVAESVAHAQAARSSRLAPRAAASSFTMLCTSHSALAPIATAWSAMAWRYSGSWAG